jgi:hypothetical protein
MNEIKMPSVLRSWLVCDGFECFSLELTNSVQLLAIYLLIFFF